MRLLQFMQANGISNISSKRKREKNTATAAAAAAQTTKEKRKEIRINTVVNSQLWS